MAVDFAKLLEVIGSYLGRDSWLLLGEVEFAFRTWWHSHIR